ncbi:MAG: rhodanese-like domain-containing protein [Sedimenticolaceae bacterium]
MRNLQWSAVLIAGLLAGCNEQPQVDMVGTAAALARTIAAEQDHVTVPELSDWIIKDRRDFELVDIREDGDYQEGHIPGARHVPLAALMSDTSLSALPPGSKVVVYSNGTAHSAQAALLLRLVDRDAYALLGGFNYWQAYLNDSATAGVAEMDPKQRAQYQAVSCFFEGDYVAAAGLVPKIAAPAPSVGQGAPKESDPLGLGLGLGSEEVKAMQLGREPARSQGQPAADPLGLGLDLGLGGEAGESLRREKQSPPKGSSAKLLIKAEC